MTVRLERSVLSERAFELLDSIFAARLGQHLYLAGGTGLPVPIGHRVSHDLDLFTVEPSDRLAPQLQRAVGRLPGRISLRERGQMDLDVEGTRVSVVAYPFAVSGLLNSGRIRLAAPAEIAAMKAYALGRPITGRDYTDLYYLLHDGHTSLDDIRRRGEDTFRIGGEPVFSFTGFLRQLVDSSDVDDWPEALSLVRDRTLSKNSIDSFFAELVLEVFGNE